MQNQTVAVQVFLFVLLLRHSNGGAHSWKYDLERAPFSGAALYP